MGATSCIHLYQEYCKVPQLLCFWLANFLFYLITGYLPFSILLRMKNQQEFSGLWGVLNEIVQSLINAGVDWLLHELALDHLKTALF